MAVSPGGVNDSQEAAQLHPSLKWAYTMTYTHTLALTGQ